MNRDDTLATANPSDPYERKGQIFPRLDDDQVARLTDYGKIEDAKEGTLLFQRGQRSVDFFLVLDGAIEILDREADGRDKVITTHNRHQFTGELDLFNNRKILVDGRTKTDSRLVRLNRDQFRRMSSTEQDIGEIIMRAFILRRSGFITHAEAGVTLVGDTNDRDVIRINRFLTRNGYPVMVSAPDSDAGRHIFGQANVTNTDTIIVRTADGEIYSNPCTADLADLLGLTEELESSHLYDVAIVGAGPAGLSACVYAASEALDTVVIEAEAPGGQAGTSSKIENYLGFPTGISGQALAGRAWIQGQKFGATFAIARGAVGIHKNPDDSICIEREGGETLKARTVILACGATYRKLDLPNYDRFEGQGIHYAATALEAQFCAGTEAVVIGGGNSAGQAAVFLSRHASQVHVLVRGDGLADSMSDYLVSRIDQSSRITLHTRTELSALEGERLLETVSWTNRDTGEKTTRNAPNVFVMIGAVPNTGWMGDCVELDAKGFIRTGVEGYYESPFATSVPGIFAVGDVRSGSVKRVASGVGEGSVCVSAVHQFLADR